MQHICLDGEWQLYCVQGGDNRPEHPDDLSCTGLAPIPACVPGNVELDLERAGRIADPFYADNIHQLRSLELFDWWYLRTIHLPATGASSSWDLVFQGLDTVATVWVNGSEVGRSANMLIEHRFDATSALRWGGANRIAVRLKSALQYARQHRYEAVDASDEHREEGLYVRKAPHMWGWDIAPRAVSAGIWRSVRLEPRPDTWIEDLYYWTINTDSDGATLGVRYQVRVDTWSPDDLVLRFHLAGDRHRLEYVWPVEFIAGGCQIEIPGADLWWPRGYGAPHLYSITAQLCQGEQTLAQRSDRVGVRKVLVARTDTPAPEWAASASTHGARRIDVPPDPLSRFVLYVNDVPIMLKGTNWSLLDAFHSRDAQRLVRAVELAEELGCNMIRCWGGNVYEGDCFFDLCDEKGILVWQDFAFACCRYPQSEAFLAEVQDEVETVVRRLRNHPSLALWCGDNEVDLNTLRDGLLPQHNRLTRELIPQIVYRLDPYRYYLPSSPSISPIVAQQAGGAATAGEQHLWGPRRNFKGTYYSHHRGHLISEIGYFGCPSPASLRRFLPEDRLWPWQNNKDWQIHSGYHWQHLKVDRNRVTLLIDQVRELFGMVPSDLHGLALASQITQAEALKYLIESTRLRKWRTSGILWWNLIDGWPQFSDAVVDYYFMKKLAFHYIKRVQQPVCVLIGEPDGNGYAPVVVGNDSRSWAQGTYRVREGEQDQTVAEGSFAVPPNQNWQLARVRTFAGECQFYLIDWEMSSGVFGNHCVLGPPPLSLDRYRQWLPAIASLNPSFEEARFGA